MPDVISRGSLTALLGRSRFESYVRASGGDTAKAAELCQWATRVAGALHAQLAFVEIAMRNALDRELSVWNAARGSDAEWTGLHATADPLYGLLKAPLATARRRALDEDARRRPHLADGEHTAAHDDVVAQLTFGAWVNLVHTTSDPTRQADLWADALHRSFPLAPPKDESWVAIGRRLETLRRLRNRVAHHDDLLDVAVPRRPNGMLSVLG